MEVPVEAVVVVAGGHDRAHDQPASPANFGRANRKIEVLPRDADVFLVDADGVADHVRIAALAGHHGVEIADLADTVTALFERVGHLAETTLAHREGDLPSVPRSCDP